MKRLVLLGFLAVSIISCENNDSYSIEGTMKGAEDGTALYLQDIDENNLLRAQDTAIVKDGKFSFGPKKIESNALNIISVDNAPGNIVFMAENEKIKITAHKDSLRDAKIKGGSDNDYFKTYFDEVMAVNKEKMALNQEGMVAMRANDSAKVEILRNEMGDIDNAATRRRMKMIEEHPDSYVSVLILGDLLGQRQIEATEAEEAFEGLTKAVQETNKGQTVKKLIAQVKSQEIASKLANVGNKAPSFSGPTPEGGTLALNEVLGKYTIIDFWASWCRPCRMENPNVVKVYNKYHDKGLNIISVSLDKESQKDRWLQAIEDDNMDWHHISHLKYFDDPIAKKYGITSIPATFLLDENGVIIDKDLRGQDLEDKIESLLGES